ERVELEPFRQALAAGCPAVLVAHVRYPALDAEWPASLSEEIIGGLLRGRWGVTGFLLSDDLEMAAVRNGWGVGGGAAPRPAVGGDLALVCRHSASRDDAMTTVGRALRTGAIPQEAALAACRRRAALRRWVEHAAPRPEVTVIGCAEHRELLAEVLRRSGDGQAAAGRDPAAA